MITAKKIGDKTEYAPELTCCDYSAHLRKQQLEMKGFVVNITQYEVKTQGKNYGEIAQPKRFIA